MVVVVPVDHGDGVVGELAAGQGPHRDDPAAGADRRTHPSQRVCGWTAAQRVRDQARGRHDAAALSRVRPGVAYRPPTGDRTDRPGGRCANRGHRRPV